MSFEVAQGIFIAYFNLASPLFFGLVANYHYGLLLLAASRSAWSTSPGSSLRNKSSYPPSSWQPSSPTLFRLPFLKSQYGSLPASFDPELLKAPRRICDWVRASSRSERGWIQFMKTKGTRAMVAVSARHPARTFGETGEETDEAVSLLLEEREVPVTVDFEDGCFIKCRRSSRATWGGILLAICDFTR